MAPKLPLSRGRQTIYPLRRYSVDTAPPGQSGIPFLCVRLLMIAEMNSVNPAPDLAGAPPQGTSLPARSPGDADDARRKMK
jgi:hypothetical protein